MSRPRKIIELFCADVDERSVMTFVLDCEGYRVLVNSGVRPDLYLVLHTILDAGTKANAFGTAVCRDHRDVPVLAILLGKHNLSTVKYPATRILHAPEMRDLLEAVRLGIARKRGPKPQPRDSATFTVRAASQVSPMTAPRGDAWDHSEKRSRIERLMALSGRLR